MDVFFFSPCLLLPPLISQPEPRARVCSPVYEFCAHVPQCSDVYCRGALTVMRPHVSEPFFFSEGSRLHLRLASGHASIPCANQPATLQTGFILRGFFYGESEVRKKVVCEDASRCFSCGAEGEPGYLRGVVTASLLVSPPLASHDYVEFLLFFAPSFSPSLLGI